VTAHPNAERLARQRTEACAWDEPPRYLIYDRDGAYGAAFIRRIRAMGIRDPPVSARSPCQSGYAERLIGSIRRECLDHVVVVAEVSRGEAVTPPNQALLGRTRAPQIDHARA
jgi:transposase InsO family protein